MKVLDLKFQAFGPFLNEQHIEFNKLNEKGLFLINGPTGTGKTTIFDAIVFALYGEASGEDRSDKTLRSDLADDSKITYVELTFEAGGQIYKVYRQPTYNRKKLKGDGFTTESGKAELYLPDDTIINLPTKVDEKLRNDILFIDKDQFKSIGLLAQGEFTKLITADSKDRAEILEKIFQKELYQKIEKKLADKLSAISKEKTKAEAEVKTLLSQVDKEIEITGYEAALSDPIYVPAFLEHANEKVDSLNKELKVAEEAKNKAEKEYNEALTRLNQLSSNNQIIAKFIKANNDLVKLKESTIKIDALENFCDRYDEFKEVNAYINQLNQADKNIDDASKTINSLINELNKISDKEKELAEKKSTYNDAKTRIDNGENKITSLRDIQAGITNVINLENDYKNADANFKKEYDNFLEKENEFKKLRNDFFASSSYNLAKELKEGDKCPVCGSIHHPELAKSSNPVSEAEFKSAEAKITSENKRIDNLRNNLVGLKSKFEGGRDNLIERLKTNGYKDADESFIKSDNVKLEIEKLQKELQKDKEFVKAFEEDNVNVSKRKSGVEGQLSTINSSLLTYRKNKKDAETEITKIFNTNKFVKSFDHCKEFLKSSNNLNPIIPASNARDIINTHRTDLLLAEKTISDTPEDLKKSELFKNDDLIQEVNDKKKVLQDANGTHNEIKNKVDNLSKLLKDIKLSYDKCSTVLNNFVALQELSSTATGKNRMKLSFKMYILTEYFDKIVDQANRRLSKITHDRYRLVRRKTLGLGNSQQGLDLDVYDAETGKERPASSLSGGEKFVSALSMALGLSDIIETEHALIQVESIFIDEGFGTLDEDYLDMAIKALESLKDDNKTVAIISHVEKLKEFIPDGLEVKKCSSGGSTVVFKEGI